MFERNVVIAQDKKRVYLILGVLFLAFSAITFMQLLTGCVYESMTYQDFYCRPTIFSKGEVLSMPNMEMTANAKKGFEYRGEELVLNITYPQFIEVLFVQNATVWLKAGAILSYNTGIDVETVYQTTKPDYFDSRTATWGYLLSKLPPQNVPVASIYAWSADKNMTILYTNGQYQNIPYPDEANKYIAHLFTINAQHIIPTTFACTNCFRTDKFKFSDFWKLLVGISSLLASFKALASVILVKPIDYESIKDDEHLHLVELG